MELSKLLENVAVIKLDGKSGVDVTNVTQNSADVTSGACFVAVKGTKRNGHAFIADAISKGAAVIIYDDAAIKAEPDKCTFVRVEDSATALGNVASNFYGQPSRRLKLVGVTGTNGKTTVATLLYHLFEQTGHRSGLISTVIYRAHEMTEEAVNTTPDAITLNRLMAAMIAEGCTHCFMEVSSHAIAQKRIAGLHFTGGVYTNITHDHLDYHHTFDEYFKVKQAFFTQLPKTAFALTNTDDPHGRMMMAPAYCSVRAYAINVPATFRCDIRRMKFNETKLAINEQKFVSQLVGEFNAYNMAAVYGAAVMLGIDADQLPEQLCRLRPVAGRFEHVQTQSGATAIVDYAHTPDALLNVINTINNLRQDGQRLITIAGCGGDRDKTKRPEMARIAVNGSDIAILTSDNPRTEDPQAILNDMTAGLGAIDETKVMVIVDRREAIRRAVAIATPTDIILVAGKGHEDYQIIGDKKIHFDDKEEVRNAEYKTEERK
jgi:UDP-N-acetylmuramoyl-L-alanyl-D-glutamate--2,6-diaminopimelate ligase